MTRNKIINRVVQAGLILLLAYFIFPILIDSIRKFNPADWEINYPLLILSLVMMQIVLYLQSAIWSWNLSFFGKKISLNKAFKIAYLAQLGRYIPGKVWQLFGMIYLASKEGIKKEEATLSFIISQIFTTPPGLLVVLLYLFVFKPSEKYAEYTAVGWIAGALIVVFLVIFFLPDLFRKVVNFMIRILRQPEVEFSLQKKVGLKVIFSYFITWNLYGIAFYLFLLSILPEYEFSIVEIIGAWTLAYLVGYWTIVLPAGIGAREAILILMLAPIVGTERAGIIVIGARVWTIVGETICSLFAWRVK